MYIQIHIFTYITAEPTSHCSRLEVGSDAVCTQKSHIFLGA